MNLKSLDKKLMKYVKEFNGHMPLIPSGKAMKAALLILFRKIAAETLEWGITKNSNIYNIPLWEYNSIMCYLKPKSLRELREYILIIINNNPKLNDEQIANKLGIDPFMASKLLHQLEKEGLISGTR